MSGTVRCPYCEYDMYKEMLDTTVYHLNLNCDELNRIKHMSSEKIVKDQIDSVLKNLKDLSYGIETELNKEGKQ